MNENANKLIISFAFSPILSIVLLLVSCSKEVAPIFSLEDIEEIEIICDSGNTYSLSNREDIDTIISKVNKAKRMPTHEMELPELDNSDRIVFHTEKAEVVGYILENSILINGELLSVTYKTSCHN